MMNSNNLEATLLNPNDPKDAELLEELLPQSNDMRNKTENNKFLHRMRFKLGMRDSLYSLVANNPDYDDSPEFYNEGSNFATLYGEDTVTRLKRDSQRKYDLFLEARAMGKDYADSLAYAHNQAENIKSKNRSKK
jgi:hypothetical protein